MEPNDNSFPRLRISRDVLAVLRPSEQSLLRQMLREPMHFVPNRAYSLPGAERRIMGDGGHESRMPAQRFIQALADPIGEREDIEIPRGAVLSAAQERRLFMQYNYCRYRLAGLVGSTNGTPVGLGRLREMLAWFARVLDLRDQLAHANMPLVLAMAKRTQIPGVDFTELVSEGSMALLRSVEKFDVERGFKFSTYACRSILKSFNRLATRTGRYRRRFPVEFDPDLERIDQAQVRHGNEGLSAVEALQEVLDGNLAHLNGLERTVVRERYALDAGGKRRTLAEVGQAVGLTNERVRQIQSRAFGKIRQALQEEASAD